MTSQSGTGVVLTSEQLAKMNHQDTEVRWQNFRGFADTGYIRFRPITVILGSNNSGKTSLVAPLLALRQTLSSRDPSVPLVTKGALANLGSFENLIKDHNTASPLVLRINYSPRYAHDLEPIGHEPPASTELTYVHQQGGAGVALESFVIRDCGDRELLRLALADDGSFEASGWAAASKSEQKRQPMAPNRFVFDPTQALFAFLMESHQSKKPRKGGLLSDRMAHYLSVLGWNAEVLRYRLQQLSYLGPLREAPRRHYELSGEPPRDVGIRGEKAPEIVYRVRNRVFQEQVGSWLERFDLPRHLVFDSAGDSGFQFGTRRSPKSPTINFADSGFGLSQVFPLIVQGLRARPGTLLVAEQPEIHLNPKLQAELASFFVDIAKRGKRVVVETHSEHIVLRLRRLIADGTIEGDMVSILFVERDAQGSRVREIPLSKTGLVSPPEEWPAGFFSDSLRETLAISASQPRKKSRE